MANCEDKQKMASVRALGVLRVKFAFKIAERQISSFEIQSEAHQLDANSCFQTAENEYQVPFFLKAYLESLGSIVFEIYVTHKTQTERLLSFSDAKISTNFNSFSKSCYVKPSNTEFYIPSSSYSNRT